MGAHTKPLHTFHNAVTQAQHKIEEFLQLQSSRALDLPQLILKCDYTVVPGTSRYVRYFHDFLPPLASCTPSSQRDLRSLFAGSNSECSFECTSAGGARRGGGDLE